MNDLDRAVERLEADASHFGTRAAMYSPVVLRQPMAIAEDLRTILTALRQQSPISGEGWQDISTAPDDDSEFMIGVWFDGEWLTAVSHRENPSGPHETRGWNHRNGPLPAYPTHWTHCPPLPAPPVPSVSGGEDHSSSLRDTHRGAETATRDPSRLWASDLTDAELAAELVRTGAAIDRLHAGASDGEELGGGSPGEGLYERHEEVTRETILRATTNEPSSDSEGGV